MAGQKFYRPNRRPSEDKPPGNDNPIVPSGRSQRSSNVLGKSGQSLDDIDNVLSDNEKFRENLGSSSGDATSNGSSGSQSKEKLSPEELGQAEARGATASSNPQEKNEKASSGLGESDQIGEGYKNEGKKRRGIRGLMTKKRAIGGGLGGIILGLAVGTFSVLQGPWQLIQLGEILDKFSRSNTHSISVRLNKFTRSGRVASTGDVGESRLGFLASRRFRGVQARLSEVGIDFQSDPRTGRFSSQTIDAAKNPEFRGKSLTETRNAIASFYDVDVGKVEQFSGLGDGKFRINASDLRTGEARSLSFTNLKHLESGKLSGSLNRRAFADFFKLPSLFHPIKRSSASVEQRYYSNLARRERESERRNTRRAQLKEKYSNARNRLKEKIDPHRRTLNNSLLATAGVCLARDFANLIPLLNYGEVVVPAMMEATDKMAVQSQIKSNQDFASEDLGDVSASLIDEEGRSVWESKPLNALATDTQGAGEEIPDEYKQAFSVHTSQNSILAGLKSFGSFGGSGLGKAFSAALCSTPGLIVQGLAGTLLLLTGPGGWAYKATQTSISTVATAAALKFVEKLLIANFAAEAINTFGGPLGGSLLAFGARASANLGAASMGGVALPNSETQIVASGADKLDKRRFRNKSFAARILDLNDSRSLVSLGMSSMIAYNPRNIPGLMSTFTNPPYLLASAFDSFGPKIYAQESDSYDWSSPIYTLPDIALQDPEYEDPIENSEKMVDLLNSGKASDYVKRARSCFGVDIKKDIYGWDVLQVEAVNPTDDEYVDAKCSDLSDQNWVRTLTFVFDTMVITTVDCYEGGSESCEHIGGGANSSSYTNVNVSDQIAVGTYTNSTEVPCAPDTTDLGPVQTRYTGKLNKTDSPPEIRLCQLSSIAGNGNNPSGANISGGAVVNSVVSGAWQNLGKAAISAGVPLSASSSFRLADSCGGTGDGTNCASPGSSYHQLGIAIDFAGTSVYGTSTTSCTGRARDPSSPVWNWLLNNAHVYGMKQYSYESWHWDPAPDTNRCGPGQ